MTRLPAVRSRKLIRVLEKAGFTVQRQRGSHVFLKHQTNGLRTCVPMHSTDLDRGLVKIILKQVKIAEEEFLNLL